MSNPLPERRRLLCQTSVLLKKDETIQSYTEKVQYLEEFTTKLPSQPNIKEELMMTRVSIEARLDFQLRFPPLVMPL